VNPKSLEIVTAKLEASLATAKLEDRYQFERLGYFSLDAKDSFASVSRSENRGQTPGGQQATTVPPSKLIFNRTITLKDTWAK
jgi:glutaminyl-tRNA synthetase